MASFSTHLSFGIAFGALAVVAVFALSLVPPSWTFPILIFLSAVVAAILPDLDSDTGVPFHLTFGSLALAAAGVVFWAVIRASSDAYATATLAAAGALFLVWVVFGAVFKKLTKHRGMAHSVPAAALGALVLFSVAVRAGLEPWPSFLLGVAFLGGYLLHLVLDEAVSAVNFPGKPFVPNAALGSALKFRSGRGAVDAAVYAAIAFLVLGNGGTLLAFARRLLDAL
ncbi:metal-dependent hydrolase [Candidatus Uhrbacteria bacterium]|nr:metal-dependent hydrolase [Candidatus Uhrbacteria bacterium]